MNVTGLRAARFIKDRCDDADHVLTGRGREESRALFGVERFQGRIPAMADIAGFGLDIGDLVDFLLLVGEFDLSGFVVDANGFDFFLAGDVHNDLVDIVPGIAHHGIVGA